MDENFKVKLGDSVIHNLDSLQRKLKVVSLFRWLSTVKVQAVDKCGYFYKDSIDYFSKINDL